MQDSALGARSWWRTGRSFMRLVLDRMPVTAAGTVLLGGALVAGWLYGAHRQDLVLLTVGLGAAGLFGLGLLATVAAAVGVRRALPAREQPEALELVSGRPGASGFAFPAFWWLPLVAVSWRWSAPLAQVELRGRGGRLEERVHPPRRGSWDRICRRFEVGDAFGLFRVIGYREEVRPVRVVPDPGKLQPFCIVQGQAEGEAWADPHGAAQGDPIDIRRYGDGDPARMVLWRVFARSRQLVVRTPETARAPAPGLVVYLVCGEGDEPAAAAAWVLVNAGLLEPDGVFGADGCDTPTSDPTEARAAILASGDVAPAEGAAGLASFLAQVPRTGALVLTPARPGPWLSQLCASLEGGGTRRMSFVVCCDGVIRETSGAWGRLLWRPRPRPETRPTPEELARVEQALSALGTVRVLDRQHGAPVQAIAARAAK